MPKNADFHRERFKFRFLDLTEAAVARLRTMMKTTGLRVHRRPSGFVVTLPITEGFAREQLFQYLLEEKLSRDSCGVWVSVLSSSDHDGLSVPEFILEIIRKTRCGLDFSFVGCLDGEADEELV